MKIIILSAGHIDYTHLPIGTSTSNAMVPVNGKPVIAWILEDIAQKKVPSATIVIRSNDHLLKHFISNMQFDLLQLNYVETENTQSILESLQLGLAETDDEEVGVLLGDTLIRDEFILEKDFVYTGEVVDSHRWCLVRTNSKNEITCYTDKAYNVELPYLALCGYYFFKNPDRLKESLQGCLQNGKKQISDLLASYGASIPVTSVAVDKWFDFGNIDNLIKSKQQLLQSRYFNTLEINPLLNTITKVSDYDEKLRLELNWYEEIPEPLKVLTPRIISKNEVNGRLHLVQEYYGYSTLAELFIYSSIDSEIWTSILTKLMDINTVFKSYQGAISSADCYYMYYTKTIERLKAIEENSYWSALLAYEKIVLNGLQMEGWPVIETKLREEVKKLAKQVDGCIIHGDFCFSNILFDYGNQIIRLIDPRGSFGKPGTFGDPRYDIAKLRHSIAGRYDLLVSDLFTLDVKVANFELNYFPIAHYEPVKDAFDELIVRRGYSLNEIKFIEGLLFISMLPLHQDKPRRQKAMFLRGIELLNEVLFK